MARRSTRPTPGRWRSVEPDHRLPPHDSAHQLPPHRADRELSVGEPAEPGLSDLVRDLARDTRQLIRQEVELAKAEAGRTAKRVAADGAWIGAGAATAAVGGLCLVLAVALGLGALLGSYWLGAALTGALLIGVGGGLAWKGVRDLKAGGLAPEETVETLREDVDWARGEMEEFKRELSKE